MEPGGTFPTDADASITSPYHASMDTPTWATWREAAGVCAYPRHLRRTFGVALLIGTILFAINHLDTVVSGHATTSTWVKGALTYLVPFCVSNYGILVATHRHEREAGPS